MGAILKQISIWGLLSFTLTGCGSTVETTDKRQDAKTSEPAKAESSARGPNEIAETSDDDALALSAVGIPDYCSSQSRYANMESVAKITTSARKSPSTYLEIPASPYTDSTQTALIGKMSGALLKVWARKMFAADRETLSLWIDYNSDKRFSAEEQVYLYSSSETLFDLSKALPYGPKGDVRARLILAYGDQAPGPCGTYMYGSTVDFTLQLEADRPYYQDHYDVNQDGTIDLSDRKLVVDQINSGSGPANYNYDVNRDGRVSALDVNILNGYIDRVFKKAITYAWQPPGSNQVSKQYVHLDYGVLTAFQSCPSGNYCSPISAPWTYNLRAYNSVTRRWNTLNKLNRGDQGVFVSAKNLNNVTKLKICVPYNHNNCSNTIAIEKLFVDYSEGFFQ